MLFYRSYRHRRRKRLLTMSLPILTLLTLLFPLYIIYKPPSLLIRYFQHRWPDILWQVHLRPDSTTTSGPLVALTLDDAPSDFTPEILRLLRENDAKATFFLIGDQIAGREQILRDVVSAGNELGNHAMFDEPSCDLSDEELASQIRAVQSRIQRIYAAVGKEAEAHDEVRIRGSGSGSTIKSRGGGGTQPKDIEEDPAELTPARYFRPGSGFFTDRMRALVRREGFRIVLGSVYPHDAQISVPWLNAEHILSMVRPGSIIVVHDRRPWTVPMLAKVLPELKHRGYRVGTVTDLLKESVAA